MEGRSGRGPDLTIVIPAFNEETRIGGTLEAISEYVRARGADAEVIVVDDGSTDQTARVVEGIAARDPAIRLLHNRGNRGKGYSVRRGMLAGRGQQLLFSDADLSTPIEEIEKLEAALDAGADIAIASRGLPDSALEVRQPWWRERMGKVFGFITRLVARLDVHDSQCGFKLFSREATETVFPRQRVEGFAFDVEVLLIARRHRLAVAEVPVRWRHAPQSKVQPIRSSVSMLCDLLRVRWMAARGLYR